MKQLYMLLCFWVIVGSWGTAQAQVSGIVFRDFDLNGVRSDTLPIEAGVSGVKVLAFVDLANMPIQRITDSDGKYSFSSSEIPAGKPVRIEFSDLPPGNYNGPYGKESATTVQFAKAPASQVNVGVNYPADYCQPTNVQFVVPCYVNGNTQITTDANGNPVANERQAGKADALVSIAYSASGVASATNFPPEHIATADQIGSVWGLAYHRRTKKIFSAAFIKRHMSLGPLGTGGIYMSDGATHKTTNFLDVKTLGIDTGADPHTGLFADKTQASADPGAMSAVGRIGIGGIDMSEDDKTLYFINLNDRKLYGVFINSMAIAPTSATAVKSWAIPAPGCSNGDFRPWALKVYHGKIYVGVVCSAETSQQKSDLRATVYRFDPNAATPQFETVLSFPLDFRRGPTDLTTDPNQPEYDCTKYDHWLPWTDAWPTPCGLGNSRRFVMYPQPILSDLEFDDDGSMLIGFMDRFGNMSGVANHDPAGTGLYDGFTGGDLLRAHNNNGTLELEKNGKSGNLIGSGVGNNEGPVDENNVGGEFFGNDYWMFHNKIGHAEVSNGSLTFIPGYTEVIASAFDPIENIYQSGGFKVFGAKTGLVNRNYVLYTLEESPGVFGKAGGLGDAKALCDPASVELGNRVWFDDNRDGIQDAYEPGIDGVVLTLHDMENGGTVVGTQTTHDGGQFYFNNVTVPGGLAYLHKYEIRMDTAQLGSLNITLDGAKPLAASGGRLAARAAGARQGAASPQRYYTLSPANQTGFANADVRDSDAQLVGKSAVIAVTTQDAGQNDFTNDLSIYSCPELTTEKDTISLCAGAKLDSIVAVGNYLSRVDSVRFVRFTSPQSGTAMYANTGVVLGTVKPGPNTNRAVLYNPLITTDNNTGNGQNQYIYAIIYPTPVNVSCRQSDKTVIKIAPSLRAMASGGTLTCSVKSLTLTGQAQYGDGSPASPAVYSWKGPASPGGASFSSVVSNPTVSVAGSYTLTVSDPACPSTMATITTNVT
ncbi:SdrD B-like domain-containing protein, partial [Spirosoma fluviale]